MLFFILEVLWRKLIVNDRKSDRNEISQFLDEEGRLTALPGKKTKRLVALNYLASKFDPSKTYNEVEVNELLKEWHTFGDWALLRRELYIARFINRNTSGSEYTLSK